MADQAYLPAMRATQNKRPGLTELAPRYLDIAGGDRDAQPDVRASSCAEIAPLVADDGDDYEIDQGRAQSLIRFWDRLVGFVFGLAMLALAEAIWMFA